MSGSGFDINSISTPRKLMLGGGILLLITSFLPWYHASFGPVSVSASGWHGLGVVSWLLLLVLLALEGARAAGALPLDDAKADLAALAAAGATILFGVIYVIIRFSDGYVGFGLYIGLIAMIVMAAGAFTLFKDSDAVDTMKSMQANSSGGSATPPPPPAPPAAPEGQTPPSAP